MGSRDPRPAMLVKDCDIWGHGHNMNWIPPLRIHMDTPRHTVFADEPSPDGWFTVRDGDTVERWWCHNPAAIAHYLPAEAERVGSTNYLVVDNVWINATTEQTPCRSNP